MTKEELISQSPEYIRLQKYRGSLIASGGAMVLFAVWTVLRSIVEIDSMLSHMGDTQKLNPLLTAIMIVGGIDLILKLYVGLSARREGMNRNRKRPYLILGIIIACLSVLSLIYMLFEFPVAYRLYGLAGTLITLAVEATVLYASMDLVFSALKVRKLENETGRA